jgi:hypothetical protein
MEIKMKRLFNRIKMKMIIILAGLFILSGCVSDSTVVSTVTAPEALTPVTEKMLPERKAEVFGVVKKIVGNEITIALLLKDSSNQNQSLNEEGIELSEEEKAAKQAAKQAENAGKSETGTMTTKETELSGETVELIIPVGTTIMQSTGTGVFNTVEIADIYIGMSIKVWTVYREEGGMDLVEFVQILTQ